MRDLSSARPSVAHAALAALALAACATSTARDQKVQRLIDAGRYGEAVEEAAAWHESAPQSEAAARVHREASAAVLLAEARTLTLAGRDEEALEKLYEAYEILPDDPILRAWIDKTHRKRAEVLLGVALEHLGSDDLVAAYDAYESALYHVPDHPRAVEGIERLLVRIDYRQSQGDAHYKSGVNDLREYLLNQARTHFAYVSGKYLPGDERADQRKEQVEELLASQRVSIAHQLEGEGFYPAARNEFRIALLSDPENVAAQEGLERLTVEVEAYDALKKAEMLVVRGRLDEAEEVLVASEATSERQAQQFVDALQALRTARLRTMYDDARTFERDYDYVAAAEGYDRVIQRAGGYFEDAIARRDTLLGFVAQAQELYAGAAEATDSAAELALLRQIEVFWPAYLDVRPRIGALEETAAPTESGAGEPR